MAEEDLGLVHAEAGDAVMPLLNHGRIEEAGELGFAHPLAQQLRHLFFQDELVNAPRFLHPLQLVGALDRAHRIEGQVG